MLSEDKGLFYIIQLKEGILWRWWMIKCGLFWHFYQFLESNYFNLTTWHLAYVKQTKSGVTIFISLAFCISVSYSNSHRFVNNWCLSELEIQAGSIVWITIPLVIIRPDFCRDMWLKKSCGLQPQENMAASGRKYRFLWLQRCCCLRQQPTVATSDRKSKRSSQWATPQKNGQLKHSWSQRDP